jgi:hypothetical protein
MSERPDPPPWGALITTALSREQVSAREAARQAGISEGRWRQISGGYQVVSPGVYAPVRGPAATLARMAAVAKVTSAELRSAGREDAALLLDARVADKSPDDQLLERIRSMSSEQARELLAQIAVQLGMAESGEDPGDHERRYGT